MIFILLPVGKMQNWSYIFADPESLEGMIIDPAFDAEKILKAVKDNKINPVRIILTHHHYDHINATKAIKTHSGAEVFCHRETATLLHGEASYDSLINDNDLFRIGRYEVRCLHTPGHAPGSLCLEIADRWLITADTLFINDCGRADLPGSDPKALFKSLQRLKEMPDHLIVCPGHDYGPIKSRTLGEEKRSNPALMAASYADFLKLP